MTGLRHVSVLESLCVKAIDVFHTLKLHSVRTTFVAVTRGVNVYSFEFSEHGSVRRNMSGPVFRIFHGEYDPAQKTDEDAGE